MVNKFGEGRVFVVGGKDAILLSPQFHALILIVKMLLMCTVPPEGR